MRVIVVPLHAYFREAHVERVKADMLRLGPPRLRGYFDQESNAWYMREGTHRLRAAKALGVTPVLVSIPWWRSRKALERARHARSRAHVFDRVDVDRWQPTPKQTASNSPRSNELWPSTTLAS